MDPLLRQYLDGRDVPCPACGFNLRGCTGERCPECGRPLSLGVQGGPALAWSSLVGLVAAAMGTGFCLIVAVTALIQSAPDWPRRMRLEVDFDREHAQVATLALVFFALTLLGWTMHARYGPSRSLWLGWPAATITLGGLAALLGLMVAMR